MTTPIYPGTVMPLMNGRAAVHLAGRAGYSIDLLPGGDTIQYAWEPEAPELGQHRGGKSPAGDLDLQMMWLKAESPINNPPLVWWRIEYGHGECVYAVPQQSPLTASPTFSTTRGWMLPQRGLRLRLPARALKIFFYVPPEAEPPPEPVVPGGAPCTIQVSVQPCEGLHPQQLPLTDGGFGQALLGGSPQQFPLGATECRFTDPNSGLPFAGAQQIIFLDITGTAVPTGAVNLSLLGDWRPIPMFAAFWLSLDDAAQASYR